MKHDKTMPEEDIEHETLVFYEPEDIARWAKAIIRKGEAYRYDFIGWPDDLWSRKATDALEFIEDRFRDTRDEREYYCCMLYLTKRMEAEELFVLWKESSNYKTLMAEKESEKYQGGINTLPRKVPGVGNLTEG